jgi:catechol 2,3-dioxygenase-like lactoylglutathione lyase family enzyme
VHRGADPRPARPPVLSQVNLVVGDMAATVAFYRRLGWTIETPTADHAVAQLPNGLLVEFDTREFARVWDTGYAGALGGSTLLGLTTETVEEVDARFADLVAHGHRGRQPPYDAFWGSRFAIVEDPDGNPIGLMSPIEESRRFWPPSEPPRAPASGPARRTSSPRGAAAQA